MSLTHSFIRLFPLFFSYLIKSFLLSLYSAPLLSSHTYSNFFLFYQSPNSTFSPSYLLPFLLCLYSLCYYPILNVFFHTFSFLSPCLCPLPLMCSPICSESISLFFLISHHSSFFSPTLSLSLCPFTTHISFFYCSFCLHSSSDPEQSVHELVYDLRSQCDAIRVTKTVRPYRMVICPVNENSAALMVSDGRAMLWELKAHTGKAAVNPRYTHTQIIL